MESAQSIVVTHLAQPTEPRFSLNRCGRRRYGTLDELLQTPGVPSTVGHQDGNIVDPTIRLSKHYRSVIDFPELPPISFLDPLIPTNKIYNGLGWPPKYDVIEYLPGGFFKEHRDAQMNKSHYATLLIFPPGYPHTGGKLTIKREDDTEFVFESSTNTQWTFIAFHTHLRHSCDEVLTGRRIVFKSELCYTRTPEQDINNYIPNIDIIVDRRYYHNPIEEYDIKHNTEIRINRPL